MVAPLPRLTGIALSFLRRHGEIELNGHVVSGGEPLGPLGQDLDRIEAAGARDAVPHMRRGSQEWSWRLSVCGERKYHFCVARRRGEPIGYVVVRRLRPGRVAQLGNREAAVITDLVAVKDDGDVLGTLAQRALAIAGEFRAVALMTTTTSASHRRALAATGFLSPTFPLIGRVLGRRSPVFMWAPAGPAAHLQADRMALTFADAAVDLDL
jgi:hypothetical protein